MPGRSRLFPVGLALCLVLAGCGQTGPTAPPGSSTIPASTTSGPPVETTGPGPSASGDVLATYASIAKDVEAIRGLEPKEDVTPILVDGARLRSDISADWDRANPPQTVRGTEHLLGGLGLLQPGTAWRQANLDLLAGQVAGYYDPTRDRLSVVSRSGAIGPTQRATYAHEFTHQLQDQNFDLGKLDLESHDRADTALARLALVEGDASLVQSQWIQRRLTAQELMQLVIDASDPAAVEALQNAPAILREKSIFAYQDGLAFVSRLMTQGGWDAVDAAYARPPDSTEQVLHPEKYVASEKPVAVSLPTAGILKALGAGWSVEAEDTLGEVVLRTWIRESGPSASDSAAIAAAGWGGDRVGVLAGPGDDRALVLVSEWDTTQDADEFAAAAAPAFGEYGIDADVVHAAGSKKVALVATPVDDVRQRVGAYLRGESGVAPVDATPR